MKKISPPSVYTFFNSLNTHFKICILIKVEQIFMYALKTHISVSITTNAKDTNPCTLNDHEQFVIM